MYPKRCKKMILIESVYLTNLSKQQGRALFNVEKPYQRFNNKLIKDLEDKVLNKNKIIIIIF